MINQTIEAYCVRCRKKQEIQNPQEVEMKRKGGKVGKALTGTCPTCGTKMFRILSSKVQAPEANVQTPKTNTPAQESNEELEVNKEMENFDTAGE